MSTRHRFETGLAATRDDLRRMSALVITALDIAERATAEPDPSARHLIRDTERTIDGLEVAIESRCHELMVLEAPMAGDLRLLISAMRISTDLENIGDLAEGVAKRFSSLAAGTRVATPPELIELAHLPGTMLKTAMQAFETGDMASISGIDADERRSDALVKLCSASIQRTMVEHPQEVRELTQVLRAVYHYEQAADLCVCITEEVVYFHSGMLTRHHHGTDRFQKH
jgi:phosphate transport system protein